MMLAAEVSLRQWGMVQAVGVVAVAAWSLCEILLGKDHP